MSTALLVRVWLFVASAFLLGLVVGWLFWRFRRSSVPTVDWRAQQAELATLRRRAADAGAARAVLDEHIGRARDDSARLAHLLHTTWGEREAWRARAVHLDAQATALHEELRQARAFAWHLQRRATEWTVAGGPRPPLPPSPPPSAVLAGLPRTVPSGPAGASAPTGPAAPPAAPAAAPVGPATGPGGLPPGGPRGDPASPNGLPETRHPASLA